MFFTSTLTSLSLHFICRFGLKFDLLPILIWSHILSHILGNISQGSEILSLQFRIIVHRPINFWIFCRINLFLFGPPNPAPPPPLHIFQRLLKRIVLNKESQKQGINEMEQEEQEDEYINVFDFLNNF